MPHVFLAYHIFPLVLKLHNANNIYCNGVNSYTTTMRTGLSINFFSSLRYNYDVDEKSLGKVSNVSELSLFKRAL